MKYAVRSTVYPEPIIYTAKGPAVFADSIYETDDADVARELVKRDDVVLERGKLPSAKGSQKASEE